MDLVKMLAVGQSKLANAANLLHIEGMPNYQVPLNNDYLDNLQANGLFASGMNENTNLVEIVEIKEHPWFVGVQFHPEYKSTVATPHPLFVSFVKAALKNKS